MHQFVHRAPGEVRDENLFCDRLIGYLYGRVREQAPALFRALTSGRTSSLLGFLNYDLPLEARLSSPDRLARQLGIDLNECLRPAAYYSTARRIFERQIRYESARPMDESPAAVASPADSRMFVGGLGADSVFFIKDKFFSFPELLGPQKRDWLAAFHGGDFAVFRLTPEKYHYNHVPVSGVVRDIYPIEGAFHSCNPTAVIREATPFSRNRRVVTIIDTDVPGGSGCGLVAMVEVVALMIGQIVQAYSDSGYDAPQTVRPGLFLRKGQPKSLYRPGSSLDVLIFQQGRVDFCADLVRNQGRARVNSRFSDWLARPWVETDVRVRDTIAWARNPEA